jgi:hypothetical protein
MSGMCRVPLRQVAQTRQSNFEAHGLQLDSKEQHIVVQEHGPACLVSGKHKIVRSTAQGSTKLSGARFPGKLGNFSETRQPGFREAQNCLQWIMIHWKFVVVPEGSNAKKESFCCTEPQRLDQIYHSNQGQTKTKFSFFHDIFEGNRGVETKAQSGKGDGPSNSRTL